MVVIMFIQDVKNFPVIDVSFLEKDAVSVQKTIEIYESLLSRKEKFVFLSTGLLPQPNSAQNHQEDRKKVAAWVKANRETLAHYVKAFIQIEPDAEIRLQTQKFAHNFIKFSGYPMFIVDDQAQAQKLIDAVLK